jgi:DNA polymerase I-like protein with 3'-5' exonuclease and polymerase domains
MITTTDIAARVKRELQEHKADGKAIRRVLFVCSEQERQATNVLKKWCVANKVLGTFAFGPRTPAALAKLANCGRYDMLCVTSEETFKGLGPYYQEGSKDAWRGSVLPARSTPSGIQIPTLLVHSLIDKQGRQKEYTMPDFTWLLAKDLSKINTYKGQYNYRYIEVNGADDQWKLEEMIAHGKQAFIITCDIETNLNNFITSIAFTCVHKHSEGKYFIGRTYVVDWGSNFTEAYLACAYMLGQTEAHKCFHNGCFDMTLLMRHRIGVLNWDLDTEYMWHSWEAEAKKSLAFVSSLALPDYIYWKTEGETDPLGYNAKDSINTARSLLWLFKEMPDWAWRNYAQMVPLFLPTVMCNLEGFATDTERLSAAKTVAEEVRKRTEAEVKVMLGVPTLNLASPKQLSHLLYRVLGPVFGWSKPITAASKKVKEATGKSSAGTDKISLQQLQLKHPIPARVITSLLSMRAMAKSISNYYNAPLYGESKRLYYTLQIDGTKTGRYSCNASSFRFIKHLGKGGQLISGGIKQYGTQIQNAPPYYKTALCADPGYLIWNIDKSKSEAHCVALISGDKKFTQAIQDTSRDFYLKLAEWFFGMCTEDKEDPIRQVTKKVNHATSYCMGWEVFLDQVGITKLYEFMRLAQWTGPKQPKIFITHLIDGCFHATFPGIKQWWKRTTKELVDSAGYLRTPDGAVRHFFKYPRQYSGLSPAAVAHQPQRLSVVTLNRNMAQVFYEVQIPSKFSLRLKGQVHDSLVGQVQEGHEHLVQQVKEIMERPYETELGPLAIPCDLDKLQFHWKEPKEKKQLVQMEDILDSEEQAATANIAEHA